MKKNIITATALASFFVGIVSCTKELDQKPTDTITEENAFVSMKDLQEAANAMYGRYLNKVNSIISTSLLTDEIKLGRDNSGQGRFTYTYTFASDATSGGDVNAIWGTLPSVVDQANRVLENADKVTAVDAFETSRRSILKGQARGMRALVQLEMLQAYAKAYDPNDPLGVPYPLVPVKTSKPSRLSVAECVRLIEEDLTTAKSLLPAVTSATFSDTVINSITISAIQARLALYKKDWQKAVDYSTEVINSGIKPLVTGTQFTQIWVDGNQNEILFRIRQQLPTATTVGSLYTSGSLVYYEPSQKYIGALTELSSLGYEDYRASAYIGTAKIPSSSPLPPVNYVKKFYVTSKGTGVVDLKGIRTAEMYLIRAEAYAELNNLANGYADLEFLRNKRIIPAYSETFTNKADLITAIIKERYKELAFEGFRFYDLKRRGLAVERLASDIDGGTGWQTLPANNFRFTLPIPLTEILSNPNMKQNPGYN